MLLISRKFPSEAIFQNDTTAFYRTTSVRILNVMTSTETKASQRMLILKS